jgi:hypothetical protein
MTTTTEHRTALAQLDERLRAILPEEYQDTYEQMQPVAMRSAGLKFGPDGKVAWDEIWGSFCDLAMAGGPPHKGTLLEAGRAADVFANPDRHDEVAGEICRGIIMAADLMARRSEWPGWIRVDCASEAMAGWLVRAIVMENVAVRLDGAALHLPAAPHFRLDKEIKNVVTVIAKTSHYWVSHMSPAQRRTIAALFTAIGEETPLVEPALSDATASGGDHETARAQLAERIQEHTGLQPSGHRYAGWLGVESPSVKAAVWMMRALVVNNVLARREETTLFVPVNPVRDPDGRTVASFVTRIHGLAVAKGVL